MSNKDVTKTNQSGQNLTTPGSNTPFLDSAFNSLTTEQKKRMNEIAATHAMDQEVKDRDAARRFHASGADMQRHMDNVREHEKIKADFDIRSEIETASGKTTIKVSKANNTLYIVIAVVIAIVFFVLFSN